MYTDLKQEIRNLLQVQYPDLRGMDILISYPPDLKLGDLSVPLFALSKRLDISISQLADECISLFRSHPWIVNIKQVGGYLNIYLNRNLYARSVIETVLQEKDFYGSLRTGVGKKALIEHTSINPNASPHVGRARNAMIGDCLARLLRFEGYETEVHYYVNDMGRQIGLLVLIADEIEGLDFNGILDAYVRANQRAEEDEQFAQQGYELLARMENGDESVRERFFKVTEMCLRGQLEVLKRLGVGYDYFDRESDFIESQELEKVLMNLRWKEALFLDEEGRLTVDLSKLGYTQEEGRFFVLRRANGSSMYGYRDLAYTIYKGGRGADMNLIVLGEDHKLYFQQISLILTSAGFNVPEAVFYSYILLKDGKMSTRRGNVVLLSELLDDATCLALERVQQQYQDMPEEEQKRIAEQIAISAIRFSVLRVTPTKNVVFDLDSALSFEGDTGPYLQYACARIKSIMRKADCEVPKKVENAFELRTDEEWMLIRKVAEFPEVVSNSILQRNPAILAGFALELTKFFTSFYHNCPVLYSESEQIKKDRLQICAVSLLTLQNALGLLGIPVPERM